MDTSDPPNDTSMDDTGETKKVHKPNKRSTIERQLETNLTALITSPATNDDSPASTSRYGRALKSIHNDNGGEKEVIKLLKSPLSEVTPIKYNSPPLINTPNSDLQLVDRIEMIYKQNISLSRFGNTNSDSNGSDKRYIQKDLIQSKDSLDCMSQSKASTSTHLNNILERSSAKYSLENYVPSVVKVIDFGPDRVDPSAPISDLETICDFQVGDLAWARVGGFPFWPCIVSRDPYTDKFVTKKAIGKVEKLSIHVIYFGDNGRRGWIFDTTLRKYEGIQEFKTAQKQLTHEIKKKDPKLYAAYFISEKRQPKWKISVDEAEIIYKEPKERRLDTLYDMLQRNQVTKLTPNRKEREKIAKLSRKSSDVSLSESLFDTLFSEDDSKADDSDSSKRKHKKASLDVSEVVTACLDDMAAKTGLKRIQKQSHMDRWLEKAKSKTPEKGNKLSLSISKIVGQTEALTPMVSVTKKGKVKLKGTNKTKEVTLKKSFFDDNNSTKELIKDNAEKQIPKKTIKKMCTHKSFSKRMNDSLSTENELIQNILIDESSNDNKLLNSTVESQIPENDISQNSTSSYSPKSNEGKLNNTSLVSVSKHVNNLINLTNKNELFESIPTGESLYNTKFLNEIVTDKYHTKRVVKANKKRRFIRKSQKPGKRIIYKRRKILPTDCDANVNISMTETMECDKQTLAKSIESLKSTISTESPFHNKQTSTKTDKKRRKRNKCKFPIRLSKRLNQSLIDEIQLSDKNLSADSDLIEVNFLTESKKTAANENNESAVIESPKKDAINLPKKKVKKTFRTSKRIKIAKCNPTSEIINEYNENIRNKAGDIEESVDFKNKQLSNNIVETTKNNDVKMPRNTKKIPLSTKTSQNLPSEIVLNDAFIESNLVNQSVETESNNVKFHNDLLPDPQIKFKVATKTNLKKYQRRRKTLTPKRLRKIVKTDNTIKNMPFDKPPNIAENNLILITNTTVMETDDVQLSNIFLAEQEANEASIFHKTHLSEVSDKNISNKGQKRCRTLTPIRSSKRLSNSITNENIEMVKAPIISTENHPINQVAQTIDVVVHNTEKTSGINENQSLKNKNISNTDRAKNKRGSLKKLKKNDTNNMQTNEAIIAEESNSDAVTISLLLENSDITNNSVAHVDNLIESQSNKDMQVLEPAKPFLKDNNCIKLNVVAEINKNTTNNQTAEVNAPLVNEVQLSLNKNILKEDCQLDKTPTRKRSLKRKTKTIITNMQVDKSNQGESESDMVTAYVATNTYNNSKGHLNNTIDDATVVSDTELSENTSKLIKEQNQTLTPKRSSKRINKSVTNENIQIGEALSLALSKESDVIESNSVKKIIEKYTSDKPYADKIGPNVIENQVSDAKNNLSISCERNKTITPTRFSKRINKSVTNIMQINDLPNIDSVKGNEYDMVTVPVPLEVVFNDTLLLENEDQHNSITPTPKKKNKCLAENMPLNESTEITIAKENDSDMETVFTAIDIRDITINKALIGNSENVNEMYEDKHRSSTSTPTRCSKRINRNITSKNTQIEPSKQILTENEPKLAKESTDAVSNINEKQPCKTKCISNEDSNNTLTPTRSFKETIESVIDNERNKSPIVNIEHNESCLIFLEKEQTIEFSEKSNECNAYEDKCRSRTSTPTRCSKRINKTIENKNLPTSKPPNIALSTGKNELIELNLVKKSTEAVTSNNDTDNNLPNVIKKNVTDAKNDLICQRKKTTSTRFSKRTNKNVTNNMELNHICVAKVSDSDFFKVSVPLKTIDQHITNKDTVYKEVLLKNKDQHSSINMEINESTEVALAKEKDLNIITGSTVIKTSDGKLNKVSIYLSAKPNKIYKKRKTLSLTRTSKRITKTAENETTQIGDQLKIDPIKENLLKISPNGHNLANVSIEMESNIDENKSKNIFNEDESKIPNTTSVIDEEICPNEYTLGNAFIEMESNIDKKVTSKSISILNEDRRKPSTSTSVIDKETSPNERTLANASIEVELNIDEKVKSKSKRIVNEDGSKTSTMTSVIDMKINKLPIVDNDHNESCVVKNNIGENAKNNEKLETQRNENLQMNVISSSTKEMIPMKDVKVTDTITEKQSKQIPGCVIIEMESNIVEKISSKRKIILNEDESKTSITISVLDKNMLPIVENEHNEHNIGVTNKEKHETQRNKNLQINVISPAIKDVKVTDNTITDKHIEQIPEREISVSLNEDFQKDTLIYPKSCVNSSAPNVNVCPTENLQNDVLSKTLTNKSDKDKLFANSGTSDKKQFTEDDASTRFLKGINKILNEFDRPITDLPKVNQEQCILSNVNDTGNTYLNSFSIIKDDIDITNTNNIVDKKTHSWNTNITIKKDGSSKQRHTLEESNTKLENVENSKTVNLNPKPSETRDNRNIRSKSVTQIEGELLTCSQDRKKMQTDSFVETNKWKQNTTESVLPPNHKIETMLGNELPNNKNNDFSNKTDRQNKTLKRLKPVGKRFNESFEMEDSQLLINHNIIRIATENSLIQICPDHSPRLSISPKDNELFEKKRHDRNDEQLDNSNESFSSSNIIDHNVAVSYSPEPTDSFSITYTQEVDQYFKLSTSTNEESQTVSSDYVQEKISDVGKNISGSAILENNLIVKQADIVNDCSVQAKPESQTNTKAKLAAAELKNSSNYSAPRVKINKLVNGITECQDYFDEYAHLPAIPFELQNIMNSESMQLLSSSSDETVLNHKTFVENDKYKDVCNSIEESNYKSNNSVVNTINANDEWLKTKQNFTDNVANAQLNNMDACKDISNMNMESVIYEKSVNEPISKQQLEAPLINSYMDVNKIDAEYSNPYFLKYVELKQDSLIDENPDLSEKDILSYLYKTWTYEQGLKTDDIKDDDVKLSNLIKGLSPKIKKTVKTSKSKKSNNIKHNCKVDDYFAVVDKARATERKKSKTKNSSIMIQDKLPIITNGEDNTTSKQVLLHKDNNLTNKSINETNNDNFNNNLTDSIESVATIPADQTIISINENLEFPDRYQLTGLQNANDVEVMSKSLEFVEVKNAESGEEVCNLLSEAAGTENSMFNDKNYENDKDVPDTRLIEVKDIGVSDDGGINEKENTDSDSFVDSDFIEKQMSTPVQEEHIKAYDNPDFQKYVELKQDTLLDENPDLLESEILCYLYKTWNYEQELKSDHIKMDDLKESNLIKGLETETNKAIRKNKKKCKNKIRLISDTSSDEDSDFLLVSNKREQSERLKRIREKQYLEKQDKQDLLTWITKSEDNNAQSLKDLNTKFNSNIPDCTKEEIDSTVIEPIVYTDQNIANSIELTEERERDSVELDYPEFSIDPSDETYINTKKTAKSVPNNEQFLKYVELRQDSIMDEYPELSKEDLMSYLYKTWSYEETLKSEEIKNDDLQQSNLVKGLDEDKPPAPAKRAYRKKPKVDKHYDSDDNIVKDKPKRKATKAYYNENDSFSDSDGLDNLDATGRPIYLKSTESAESSQSLEVEENTYDEIEYFFSQMTQPKPNVFKGLAREKVCEICETTTSLIKCKSCYGMFHMDCVKNQYKVKEIEKPLVRGRKKKNKGKKGQNDEESTDLNNSIDEDEKSIEELNSLSLTTDVVDFESQMEAKMKEIINTDSLYDSQYTSEEELDWKTSVAGQCEIVDFKLKPKVIEKCYGDFKCNDCQKYNTPVCFVCKSAVSPKSGIDIREKCNVQHCHKYYHMECLDHWPQTHITSGELTRNSKKNLVSESFTCPRHVCHTCVCDDPRGCKTRFCADKLAKCVRCPAVYHSFTKCLPAGTTVLTASHIICPRHYELKPGKMPCHVNTGWCFICALGGTLICCEYCPTSFHAECLNIKPPEGGYMCEDCETGRLPLYGEMVWVKLGNYRWWPGLVLHPTEIPENVMSLKHYLGEFVVRFFGQYDHYWVNRGRVFPFQEGDSGNISSHKSKIDAAFTTAMEDAQKACEILKSVVPNEEESLDIQSSLLAPHYVKLKVNRPCGSLLSWRPDDIEANSLTQCECDPRDPEPCGPEEQCLNRMLLTECGPTCRAGDRCYNRNFEKRNYPKMVPYRTSWRGWGLKTLELIKKGQFVIEYVGELIDEEEFRRRMTRKHEVRDENFYFLTLDKDRMIDAGPKGNLARFMNHSCEPNCETQKWTVLGDVRVGLFAIKDIPANTEVNFNYNFECAGMEKKKCMCGARLCSGYIGAKPKQEESQSKRPKLTEKKRVYRKRKNTTESPSTSKVRGRPRKPREITELEKDLLIINSATNGIPSDTETENPLKRKRVDFSLEDGDEILTKKAKICVPNPNPVIVDPNEKTV